MRKCWSLTFGVLFFLCLFIGVAIAVDYVIPPPCLIRANNVTVDGTILTGANADYTIKVTNTAGTEYTPVDTAGSSFGSPVAGRFQYLVPKYDGTDQPGGAKTDGKACIELYYKGTKLIMTYPAQGSCPAGSGEVIIQGDGETMGFGGLKGMPDDGAHTFPDPFTVKTPAPNIAMTYDGNAISNGGTIPFGTVLQQTAKTIVLTLHNNGDEGTTLTTATPVLGGADADKFTVTPTTGLSIPKGATSNNTYSITFTAPSTDASYVATFGFTTNVAGSSATILFNLTAASMAEPVANVSLGGDVFPLGGFVGGINFGKIDVGGVSAAKTITITNSGNYNLVIGAITWGGSATQFISTSDTCSGITIAPTTSCNVVGTFNPTNAGNQSATLTFATNRLKTGEGKDNPTDTSTVVTLTGKGVQLGFTVLPASLDFGTLTLPDTTSKNLVTVVTNTGSDPLTAVTPYMSGAQFTVLPTAPFDLAVDESATLTVTYTAVSGATPHTGALVVTSGGITKTVSLTGKTVTRPTTPTISTTPTVSAPLMPEFTGSPFSSPDGSGVTQSGSQWNVVDSLNYQVYTTSTIDPSGNVIPGWDPSNLTSFTLPKGILKYGSTYTASVAYRDNRNISSFLSSPVPFTTLKNPNPLQYDAYGNPFVNNQVTYKSTLGVIKTQTNLNYGTEFNLLINSTAFKIQVPQISTVSTIVTNGTTGKVQVNTGNVMMTKTNGGSGQQAVVMMPSLGGGTIASIIPIDTAGMTVSDPSGNRSIAIPGLNASGYSVPYGLYDIVITGVPVIMPIQIVIVPPSPFAPDTKWYKINPSTWTPVEYPNFVVDASGNGILTLTDNGPGDSDPAVGTIRDPGFPGGGIISLSIPLTSGWNLISVPIQPTNTAIATVLSTISGSYTVVWAYMNGGWKLYDPSDVEGSTLTTIEAGAGYWIKMGSAKTLTVMGTAAPASISLGSGWNLTGYNKTAKADALDVLMSIVNKYTVVWAYMNGVWKLYDPSDVPGSTLTEFLPDYGYWIKTTQAMTWSQ